MTFSYALRRTALGLAAALLVGTSGAAMAETMTMWSRAAAAAPAQGMIDLWNETHDDKIELTVIPDDQVVTKLATAVQAGDVPDLMSFDLIFMPDFMKAGFLVDLTDLLGNDPNQAKVANAFKDLATYDGKLYGTGFLPVVSILLWNKGLFKQAGLDPDKPPTTLDEVYEYAKKIRALGPDVYGYYLSGNCGGCNIFTQAPSMWGSGAYLLPRTGDDKALEGPGVKEMLEHLHRMWAEGIIPEGAQGDTGANFQAIFETGKVGMQGSGNFAIATLKANHPEIDFGIAFLPGIKPENASSFVGGDLIAIPVGAKNLDKAKEFVTWVLSDEAQLKGLAAKNTLVARTDLVENEYYKSEPRYYTTAKAVGIGQTPWVFHFNDMVNSASSPWLEMLQTAVFEGKIDEAIETARGKMKAIASE
jgi:multiple sugar transport system substrate-binding protein